MSSYQSVKDFIFSRLSKAHGALAHHAIEQEIEAVKAVISSVPPATLATILAVEEFTDLNNSDWDRMKKELEMHFDVKMLNGVLIQGEEQQQRDSLWWSSIAKQKSSKYYWSRYRAYLEKSLPPDVVKTTDDDTDIVMDNIENPEYESFSRYGMVVGHVQSGKTANYSALICKAADAGYKFIVVIAGGMNNLRNQTQERLNESFVGQTKGVQVGSGKGNTAKQSLPLSLTTVEADFNKQDADRASQGWNFDIISVPVLIVIKKNTRTLENVIEWLERQYKNGVSSHAMLMIDDESDYASINTKEEDDPTAINKKLRKLLSLFSKSAYVAYTATPYANIFIDHQGGNENLGRDLFPKDFIYALDAPTNYFGAKKIFLDSGNQHLIATDDFVRFIPLNHKKDFQVQELPPSLNEAIRHFVLNIAIRNLRGQGRKHNSMLVHATRFTDVHKQLSLKVSDYLELLKSEVLAYGNLDNSSKLSSVIQDLEVTCLFRLSTCGHNWTDVVKKLTEVIGSIIVREVHQKTVVPLEYRDDHPTYAIVIGGTSLARGYTLEGLSVSYFLRNTVFYDTLMQMGRWFGYRPGYEDLCKIYMPDGKIEDFCDIIRSTDELFNDFKVMAGMKKTPNDFGLAVRENPDSALQITARNKQKNVREFQLSVRLEGKLKETSQLSMDSNVIRENLEAVIAIVEELGAPVSDDGCVIWRRVSRDTVRRFVDQFKTVKNDVIGLKARMPVPFVKKYLEDRDTDWDVALYSGRGSNFTVGNSSITIRKEQRQLDVNKNGKFEVRNRQVSSGNAESIVLEEEEDRKASSNDRGKARSIMKRPLLMLHIMEQTKEGEELQTIAAFGISFPGSVASQDETIKLKINTVYYQNLLEELGYNLDEESDD
jgi:hypothetical protein